MMLPHRDLPLEDVEASTRDKSLRREPLPFELERFE